MRRTIRIDDITEGGLLLLLLLVAICLLKGTLHEPQTLAGNEGGGVFVEISGDIPSPGVYGFLRPPCLTTILGQGGLQLRSPYSPQGLSPQMVEKIFPWDLALQSGMKVSVSGRGKRYHIFLDEMSSFHKLTLGIPLHINRETAAGLIALPGVGPRMANAIVRERTKRSGFKKLRELLDVEGIGPGLYKRIKIHIRL